MTEPRFVVEGFCGGDYAGVYDREHEVDVSEYTERNNFTRGQLERIATELNAKYTVLVDRRIHIMRSVVLEDGDRLTRAECVELLKALDQEPGNG